SASVNLPECLLRSRRGNGDHVQFFRNQDILRSFHENSPDVSLFEAGPEPVVEGEVAAAPVGASKKRDEGPQRRARLVELYESAAVEKLIAELATKGLKIEHYSNSDKPIFELSEGEGEKAVKHPLFAIPEILNKVLEV